MNNNQSILEKLKNLIEPESSILTELHNKKNKNEDIVAKSTKNIAAKNETIGHIKNDINALESQNKTLVDAFSSLKDTDLSLITSVLKLKVNVKEDLDKLTNQLPLQITIRENDITDLETAIKKEEETLNNAKTAITELETSIEEALKNQSELIDLLEASSHGEVEITRDEVINILKKVKFNDKDAYKTAKLILFPEDELIPFFKDYKFVKPTIKVEEPVKEEPLKEEVSKENNEDIFSKDDDTFVDLDKIVSLLNEEPTSDNEKEKDEETPEDNLLEKASEPVTLEDNSVVEESSKEESEEPRENDDIISFESRLEDETPISFEELKSLFEEDKQDTPNVVEEKKEEPAIEPISLDELDAVTNSSVTSEEPVLDVKEEEQPKEEVVTKEEPTTDVNFSKDKLIALGKNASDIDLVNPFDTSNLDPEEILKTLKEEEINPSDISIITYQNGLENYLKNLKSLKNKGYNPTTMELQKFGTTLSLVDNETLEENLKILEEYKISLKNPNGKIVFKVLCQEPKTLRDNIDLIIEARETNLLTFNVKALSQNVPLILERINFCKEYNIPYTEEKNNIFSYNSYIFSQSILEELVEKEVELPKLSKKLTSELESEISKEAYETLKNKTTDEVLSDAKKFDEYSRVLNKLESITVSKEKAYIINNLAFSVENTKRNLITLVNHLDDIDQKTILAGLFYNSHKTIEDFKEVEKEL